LDIKTASSVALIYDNEQLSQQRLARGWTSKSNIASSSLNKHFILLFGKVATARVDLLNVKELKMQKITLHQRKERINRSTTLQTDRDYI
jgi:hypothetical protein